MAEQRFNMKKLQGDIAKKFLEYDFDRHGVKYGILAGEILSLEPLTKVIELLNMTRNNCPECDGTGLVPNPMKYDFGAYTSAKCPSCHGTGKDPEWHPERLVVRTG